MGFEDRLKSKLDSLSIGQRKVGTYILTHLDESSYATLAQISRTANVSETTVIRFAYSLGYDSFSSMQKSLRQGILNGNFREEGPGAPSTPCSQLLDREIEILQQTKQNLDTERVDASAECLRDADKVFAVAGRTMYPAALWFEEILGKYRSEVYSVDPDGDTFFSGVLRVTAQSVVVAVSFARHSRSTFQFVQAAKERGAYIILVTDNPQAQITHQADVVFLTGSNRDEADINTISSAAAVLNVLAAALRRLNPEGASRRLEELERLYQKRPDIMFE